METTHTVGHQALLHLPGGSLVSFRRGAAWCALHGRTREMAERPGQSPGLPSRSLGQSWQRRTQFSPAGECVATLASAACGSADQSLSAFWDSRPPGCLLRAGSHPRLARAVRTLGAGAKRTRPRQRVATLCIPMRPHINPTKDKPLCLSSALLCGPPASILAGQGRLDAALYPLLPFKLTH